MAKNKTKKLLKVSLFIFIAVVLFGKISYNDVQKIMYPQKYSEYVEKYSSEYSVSEVLIYSVIRTESGFDPESVSVADAIGLMQMTEDTFDWLKMKTGEEYVFEDLFTPEISIKYGALFLSVLMNEYETTETALAGYHAGMGNVSSWLGNPEYSEDGKTLKNIPIPDTAHYVYKVTKAMDNYNKIYTEE